MQLLQCRLCFFGVLVSHHPYERQQLRLKVYAIYWFGRLCLTHNMMSDMFCLDLLKSPRIFFFIRYGAARSESRASGREDKQINIIIGTWALHVEAKRQEEKKAENWLNFIIPPKAMSLTHSLCKSQPQKRLAVLLAPVDFLCAFVLSTLRLARGKVLIKFYVKHIIIT